MGRAGYPISSPSQSLGCRGDNSLLLFPIHARTHARALAYVLRRRGAAILLLPCLPFLAMPTVLPSPNESTDCIIYGTTFRADQYHGSAIARLAIAVEATATAAL